jgi:hypothetical protein
MQCGRVLESILRDLLKELLTNSERYHLQTNIKRLLLNDFVNSKRVTLGKLILLIKRTNAFKKLSDYHGLDKDGMYSVDFDTIITIRNKASHEGTDDSGYAACADAHIIYGYLLKLMAFVEPLLIRQKQESPSKKIIQVKQTPQEKLIKPRPKIVLEEVKSFKKTEKQKEEEPNDIDFVEVCRNKRTGKYFILLNNKRNNEALFIIPDGKEKILSFELFQDAEEMEVESLKSKRLVTKEQLEKLNSIKSVLKSTRRKRILRTKSKAEPEYIVKYRNMLNNPNSVPSIMLNIIRQKDRTSWKDVKRFLIQKYGYKESGSFSASLRVLTIDGYVETFGTGDEKIISIKNRL